MTVHIFRYSQLIDTDKMRTIEAFARASRLSAKDIVGIASKEEEGVGIISRYKRGEIDNKTFRQELNDVIVQRGGNPLEDNVFDDCWNAMCRVDPIKFQKLHQFQLDHEGCKIHIIGDTNELQHKFIGEQIALLKKKPEIGYTLSFEEHTSNRFDLAALVEKAYPSEEIVSQYIQEEGSLELLVRYYQYASSSEESSLVEQDIDISDKVVEDNTNESSDSHNLIKDTIAVMGGVSSNHDFVE